MKLLYVLLASILLAQLWMVREIRVQTYLSETDIVNMLQQTHPSNPPRNF